MTKIEPKMSALILAGAFILLAASSVSDDARRERIRRGLDAFGSSTGGSSWNSSNGGIPGVGATDRPPLISPGQ